MPIQLNLCLNLVLICVRGGGGNFSPHFLSIYYELSEWVAGELFRSCNKATLRKSEAGVEMGLDFSRARYIHSI